jgi:diguanylate cyclase (GGDEF)-like protein
MREKLVRANKTSIKQKLMMINFMTVTVLLVLLCAGLIANEFISFKRSSLEALTIQAKMIGNTSTAALSFNDFRAAGEILSTMSAASNIAGAVIYKNGTAFARYRRNNEAIDLALKPSGEGAYHFGLDYLDMTWPIRLDNETIGMIVIRSDLKDLYSHLILYSATVSAIMMASFFIAFLLLSRMQKAITSPIFGLSGLMRHISNEKDYSLRAEISGVDEFAALAEGFNGMLDQIQTRDIDLERHKETLAGANEDLRQELVKREEAEGMLHRLAFYDTLTGFPNRNMLYDRLLNTIRVDEGKKDPFAFLLMNLDRFKEINDTLGHHRGDLLLKQVGQRLREVLWERDIISRMGGDEFGILLPKLASAEHVHDVIRKILKALETPFIIENIPIAVEISIGVVLYPDHGEDPDTLMKRADVAMHLAKESGSGYFIYVPESDQNSPRRLALMGQLRQAIKQDELVLHYQPKVDLKSGSVVSAEALVRWQHPEYGIVPPDQFIFPAEKTGLIKPLTLWVLNHAIKECRLFHNMAFPLNMAINLSRRNLHDSELPGQVIGILEACGLPPEWITLEITESAIMADPAGALEILNRLNQLGLRLSIDDFGTGYSSLAALKKLPIHEIKIDRGFVREMTDDEDDEVIVRSTIDLAHNLGLKVVAEGVENQKTLNRLTELGCDIAQGYFISRPLPPEAFKPWLQGSAWGVTKGS